MKQLLCLLCASALIFISCGNEEIVSDAPEGPPGPVRTSMIEAGEWFVNNQDEDFLHYIYDPLTETYEEEGEELRAMASWWAITELAIETDDEDLWLLAEKGRDYFSQFFVENEDGTIVDFNDNKDKTGYNAFGLLALMNLDADEDLLNELASALVGQQEESGRINTLFNKTSSSNQDYFPGETMLALMHLYNDTGITAYKATVSQGFEYYAYTYWPENQNTAFVPWQTQAYYYYYLDTKDPRVLEFIYEINDYMVNRYADDESCTVFDHPGNVTAVFTEGMNKAYLLALEDGDEARIQCYGQFIIQGLERVMELQYPLEGVDPASLPIASHGGFIINEGNHQMRVDQNQHGVMAMLGALALGLVE
jgi:hypothetical protein